MLSSDYQEHRSTGKVYFTIDFKVDFNRLMPHGFFYCFVRIMGVLAEFDKLPIEKLFGTLYNGSDESSDIIVDTID